MASHPITIGSALLLEISLRISAFLSDSAVIAFCSTSTAEMQRSAELRRVHIRAPPNYQFTYRKRVIQSYLY